MSAFKLSDISDNIFEDVKNIQIKFNNGESVFISSKNLYNFDLEVAKGFPVFDDPVFKRAYQYNSGYIDIDKSFLHQMLGNNIIDKLLYRNGINSLIIECNDEYKITAESPLMLCVYDEHYATNVYSRLKYEETDDSIVIRWTPDVVL